jgi:hypothetical protein
MLPPSPITHHHYSSPNLQQQQQAIADTSHSLIVISGDDNSNTNNVSVAKVPTLTVATAAPSTTTTTSCLLDKSFTIPQFIELFDREQKPLHPLREYLLGNESTFFDVKAARLASQQQALDDREIQTIFDIDSVIVHTKNMNWCYTLDAQVSLNLLPDGSRKHSDTFTDTPNFAIGTMTLDQKLLFNVSVSLPNSLTIGQFYDILWAELVAYAMENQLPQLVNMPLSYKMAQDRSSLSGGESASSGPKVTLSAEHTAHLVDFMARNRGVKFIFWARGVKNKCRFESGMVMGSRESLLMLLRYFEKYKTPCTTITIDLGIEFQLPSKGEGRVSFWDLESMHAIVQSARRFFGIKNLTPHAFCHTSPEVGFGSIQVTMEGNARGRNERPAKHHHQQDEQQQELLRLLFRDTTKINAYSTLKELHYMPNNKQPMGNVNLVTLAQSNFEMIRSLRRTAPGSYFSHARDRFQRCMRALCDILRAELPHPRSFHARMEVRKMLPEAITMMEDGGLDTMARGLLASGAIITFQKETIIKLMLAKLNLYSEIAKGLLALQNPPLGQRQMIAWSAIMLETIFSSLNIRRVDFVELFSGDGGDSDVPHIRENISRSNYPYMEGQHVSEGLGIIFTSERTPNSTIYALPFVMRADIRDVFNVTEATYTLVNQLKECDDPRLMLTQIASMLMMEFNKALLGHLGLVGHVQPPRVITLTQAMLEEAIEASNANTADLSPEARGAGANRRLVISTSRLTLQQRFIIYFEGSHTTTQVYHSAYRYCMKHLSVNQSRYLQSIMLNLLRVQNVWPYGDSTHPYLCLSNPNNNNNTEEVRIMCLPTMAVSTTTTTASINKVNDVGSESISGVATNIPPPPPPNVMTITESVDGGSDNDEQEVDVVAANQANLNLAVWQGDGLVLPDPELTLPDEPGQRPEPRVRLLWSAAEENLIRVGVRRHGRRWDLIQANYFSKSLVPRSLTSIRRKGETMASKGTLYPPQMQQ